MLPSIIFEKSSFPKEILHCPKSFLKVVYILFYDKIQLLILTGRYHMAISSNNIQVYTTLSRDLVAEIDKDAKENFRTRSQQINMILTEYYKTRAANDPDTK